MSARDELVDEYGRADTAPLGTLADLKQKLDAYRAEVLDEGITTLRQWVAESNANLAAGLDFAVGALLALRDRETASTAPAAFFEPGHTYRHSAWRFRCATVTAHPSTGEQTAIGWLCFRANEWTTYSYSAAEWGDGWTDVTEGGAADE